MPIQHTDAHRKMLVEQAAQGVIGLQRDVANNAAVHKQWAVTESVPLADLQAKITDVLAAYEWRRAKLRHFRDVIIPSDPGFLTVGDQLMLTMQSVGGLAAEVADHIDAFDAMPRTTYAEIVAACDYLIANVQPPVSIWD
ncbi:MAG: hypothetical protein MRK00_16445 [Nitrosomonas sp.]|nr:hypothetical protein [Nitrosomonas sp.]